MAKKAFDFNRVIEKYIKNKPHIKERFTKKLEDPDLVNKDKFRNNNQISVPKRTNHN
jgi:hypothetical protein